jgi:tetratricopeptide (TPR) repeat protein
VLRDCWITTLLEEGDVESADREIEVFARQARELRYPRALGFAANHASTRALMEGRFDEAERLSREWLATCTRAGDRLGFAAFALKLMILLWEQGRTGEGLELLDVLRQTPARLPSAHEWRCGLALALSELGRREEARQIFEDFAAQKFAWIQREWCFTVQLVGMSHVCFRLGDVQRAALLYELLLPYAHRFAVTDGSPTLFLGSVARGLGVLAGMTGRRDAARRHFEAALEGETRARAWACLVRTQHDFAQLLAGGGPADRDRARRLAAQGLDAARKLGMEGLAGSLASLSAGLPVP